MMGRLVGAIALAGGLESGLPVRARTNQRPRGRGLVLGLNGVAPNRYAGWPGRLRSAEADARSLAELLRGREFQVDLHLGANVTRPRILRALEAAAVATMAGDLFVLAFAGCGGKLPDANGDEPRNEDDTWCLHDGQLVDDELLGRLARFPAGARVVVVEDSGHYNVHEARTSLEQQLFGRSPESLRVLLPEAALKAYDANRDFYDPILQADHGGEAEKLRAAILWMGACQYNQLASETAEHGLFTGTLLEEWGGGRFRGNYRDLIEQMQIRMPAYQSPRLERLGAAALGFEGAPFKI